jgi:hypothetical protein
MIEQGKNYTPKELKELLGENWYKEIFVTYPDSFRKPIINNFEEFDEKTKEIYIGIYNIIKEQNPNKEINVWASGSRVKGKWRTKEEEDEISKKYNKRPKYSDYDYITDAPIIPSPQYFFEKLGVKVDFAGGEGHKVLITI